MYLLKNSTKLFQEKISYLGTKKAIKSKVNSKNNDLLTKRPNGYSIFEKNAGRRALIKPIRLATHGNHRQRHDRFNLHATTKPINRYQPHVKDVIYLIYRILPKKDRLLIK